MFLKSKQFSLGKEVFTLVMVETTLKHTYSAYNTVGHRIEGFPDLEANSQLLKLLLYSP
jgi:hypothetical protein